MGGLPRGSKACGLAGGEAGADDAQRGLRFVIAGQAAAGCPQVGHAGHLERTERDLRGSIVVGVAPARAGGFFTQLHRPGAKGDAIGRFQPTQHGLGGDRDFTAHAPAFPNTHPGGKRPDLRTCERGMMRAQKRGERNREAAARSLQRTQMDGRRRIEILGAGEVRGAINLGAAARRTELRAERAAFELAGMNGFGEQRGESEACVAA